MRTLCRVWVGLWFFLTLHCALLAQGYTPAEDFDYKIVDDNVVITKYIKEQTGAFTVNVPPQIDGKNVVAIGERAFKGNYYLDGITLPEGITTIGEEAFAGCGSLGETFFPTSLTSIGAKAFEGSGLYQVQIPAGVASIGEKAFFECDNLVSINVSTDNSDYSSEDGILFDKGKALLIQYPGGKEGTSYTLPTSVRRVGVEAFAGNHRLTSVTLNEGLQVVERKAFGHCRNLAQINFPASLTTIGDRAFQGCDFVEVEVSAAVTQIGEGPFAECWSLQAINVEEGNQDFCSLEGVLFDKNKTRLIQYPVAKPGDSYVVPESVTVIGEAAFAACMDLRDVQFLGAVTLIGEEAFFLCTSLNSINLPASLVSLGRAAFMDCWNLSTVSFPASLQQIPDYCFTLCYDLTQVEFSEGQKTIGKHAFNGCSIADVTLPASLTALGEQAFANSYFSEYKLAEGDAALLVHEGVLYSADGKTLIDCPENKSGFYQLRPGTETIAPYAFSKSSLGDSIVVPASVIQIAVNALVASQS